MFTYANELIGTMLVAADGELGKVKDIYFEDREWGVQYLVVDTGSWPFNEKLLVLPLDAALQFSERKVLRSSLDKVELKLISEGEDPRPQ